MIAIIDSGGANIGSVQFALSRLGADSVLTSDPVVVRRADRVILPGVGACTPAMNKLKAANLVDVVRELRQPVLGICLGLQLLFESSEEGNQPCIGVFPGRCTLFDGVPNDRNHNFQDRLSVPHMGWNQLNPIRSSSLLAGIDSGDWAYFVHSYAAPVNKHTIATTEYGQSFSSVVERHNYYAMQFHPERSSTIGLKLLSNFLSIP